MMKIIKSKIVYVILGLAFALSSCGDSFFEKGGSSKEVTQEQIDEYLIRNPEKGVEIAKGYLSGAYVDMFSNDIYEHHDDSGFRASLGATDAMTDDFAMQRPFMFRDDYKHEFRFLHQRRTRVTWAQCYRVINATNKAARALDPPVEGSEETVFTGERAQYLGEALALRAYMHFFLVNMYQQPYSVNKDAPGIPIRTHRISKSGRNTVSEVYNEVILPDLLKAYELLDDKNGKDKVLATNNKSHDNINQYAVAGFIAKALCFVNDYENQWEEAAKYAGIAASGRPLLVGDALLQGFNNTGQSEIIWGTKITKETGRFYASIMSWYDPYADGYAGIGYEMSIASDLFDKIHPTDDVRRKWFLAEKTQVTATKSLGKYTAVKFRDKPEGGFSADYIYMRGAEMHFLKAEALYNAGKTGEAKSALETIMTTRQPGYTTGKSGTALLEEIQTQKRIEMWGEGVRLFDMKWRGEALDRTKATNHPSELHVLSLNANPKEFVFQIPDREIDNNPEITEQNP